VTQRIGDQPEGLFVHVQCDQEPVTNLLLEVAKAGGWELHAEASLAQLLQLRRQRWRTEDVDAATWLDAILSGCDAWWRCQEGRLEIVSNGKSAPAELKAYQQAQTQRALQQAVLHAPEHRWSAYTYLAWGRLSAATGQLAEALRLCEQGLASGTRVDCDVELLLNSARLQWGLGDRDAALRLLYRAVDVRPAHPFHAAAYLSIARLQLENGLPARAIPEAMRGLACCADSPLEPVAACLLASAHLLDGNPHGANAVLMKHRQTFREVQYRDAAALLSALSRFRATSDVDERRRVAAQLMEAVAHTDPQTLYGGHWWVLSIEALDATGLTAEANRQRRECLTTTPRFPLRDRLLLTTAREELADRSISSRPVFDLLAHGTDAAVRADVLWANADVQFHGHQTEEALRACQELVRSEGTSDELRRKALRMMGVIYQQRQDYQSAVMCFAGTLPTDSQSVNGPDQKETP
ncbi:MAG: hypothetical protein ACK5Q5_24935, partial [Planctomycetaceae bacterium]